MSLFLKKRKMTAREMIDLEKRVAGSSLAEYRHESKDIDDLVKLAEDKYRLEVRIGEEMEKRAALVPPDDNMKKGCEYGIIKLRDAEPRRFDLMHEIVHYVFDILEEGKLYVTGDGFGEEDFSENEEAIDPHEREINYMAAAVLMPKEEFRARIKEHDEQHPRQDEFRFIKLLMKDYGQSWSSIVMRIQEVRKLEAMGVL